VEEEGMFYLAGEEIRGGYDDMQLGRLTISHDPEEKFFQAANLKAVLVFQLSFKSFSFSILQLLGEREKLWFAEQ
jgi:hypothetical protein